MPTSESTLLLYICSHGKTSYLIQPLKNHQKLHIAMGSGIPLAHNQQQLNPYMGNNHTVSYTHMYMQKFSQPITGYHHLLVKSSCYSFCIHHYIYTVKRIMGKWSTNSSYNVWNLYVAIDILAPLHKVVKVCALGP